MPTVLIPDYIQNPDVEEKIFGEEATVQALGASQEDEVIPHANKADAILLYHEISITPRLIQHLSKCRIVVRCGVGYDNIDRKAAGEAGILVCNVPDYGTEEVADHAIMMLLAITRKLIPSNAAIKNGEWDPVQAFGSPRLRGQTLGLIGCGRIGTATALRAKAFGFRALFYDPYLPRGYDKALGIERADHLEDLLSQSKMVSLHCPLTEETHHILNRETLAQLPQGAYVINTARGGCVDLDALADALESQHLEAAGLDVVEDEPEVPDNIRRHPKVLLTPHVAYYSVEGFLEMRSKAAHEVLRFLRGEQVHNPVNLQWLASRSS